MPQNGMFPEDATASVTEEAKMTPNERDKTRDTPELVKCAHEGCKCRLSASRPEGKYCSEHCKEAGDLTELRCGCQHAECR